jgi:hypothetical protein
MTRTSVAPRAGRWFCAAILLCCTSPRAAEEVGAILQRKTQALMDALGTDKASVWRESLDDRGVFTSEDGEVFSKAQMVEQIRPFPPGVSGKIQVTDFKTVVQGSVAVTTWVADEHEDFHGQMLHCQYRSTDTWVKTSAGWRQIAGQTLALRTDPPAMEIPPKQLAEYCGRYQLSSGIQYEIRCTGSALEGQQTGRPAKPLRVEAPDVLFIPGQPRYRRVFQRDAAGHITGFAERREAWDLIWKRLP